jgi:hypothetical protein
MASVLLCNTSNASGGKHHHSVSSSPPFLNIPHHAWVVLSPLVGLGK